jgi:zinc protease
MKRVAMVLGGLLLSACAESLPPPAPPVSPPPAPVVPAAATPEADPAPTTEGNVTVAWIHGMQVIVERIPGAEFAVARLAIRGGVRNWTADRAGVESVALAAAVDGGTQKLGKEQLSRKLASLGATLGAEAGSEFSTITGVVPVAGFDETLGLTFDVLLAPAMPSAEVALARERALSDRRHELESGDGRLAVLTDKVVFAGHPYAARPEGTVETIGALSPDGIASHLAGLRETSRMLLVVVGDVDAAHVLDRARAAVEGVPRGSYVDTPVPPLRFDAPRAVGDLHPFATNYVGSYYAGPSWKEADYVATRVTVEVLSHRVWEEVRSKRNLSYAPWAVFRARYAQPYGGFYVSAVDPTTTLHVMMDEGRRMQTELVPADELAGVKATMRTRYAQSRETSSDEAATLVNGQLYAGDWRYLRRYGDAIAAVTPEQIRDAARRYMRGWQTVIVGEPGKLDASVVGAPSVVVERAP